MPLIFIASLALQVAFVVHVVKTGRPVMWIFIIMLLPAAGIIAYLLLEVVPDIRHSRAGRAAASNLDQLVRPNRQINELTKQASHANTVENRFQLAKECLNKDRYAEAAKLLESCLEGVHAEDPGILLALAKARFGLADFAGAVQALDRLRSADPNFQSADGHLLYARSIEGQGETERALFEYAALAEYYAGEEARARYASLLKRADRGAEAHEIFSEIVRSVESAPKPYYRAQRAWYDLARKELAD